jgi:hypothetical protein
MVYHMVKSLWRIIQQLELWRFYALKNGAFYPWKMNRFGELFHFRDEKNKPYVAPLATSLWMSLTVSNMFWCLLFPWELGKWPLLVEQLSVHPLQNCVMGRIRYSTDSIISFLGVPGIPVSDRPKRFLYDPCSYPPQKSDVPICTAIYIYIYKYIYIILYHRISMY